MSKKNAYAEKEGVVPEFLHLGSKLQDIKDEVVGAPGTAAREQYELELAQKLVSMKLREFRKKLDLTQSELGERIGVQKNQISRLERSPANVTLETILKVFGAMHIKVKFSFEEEGAPDETRQITMAG